MQKELLKRYSTIKEKIAAFETEAKLLAGEIMDEMEKADTDKHEESFGKFTICTRKSWTYTKNVTALEEKVSLAKIKEQEQGKAKAVESNYLLFKPK